MVNGTDKARTFFENEYGEQGFDAQGVEGGRGQNDTFRICLSDLASILACDENMCPSKG
ncbi:MAG: hypothetical protein ACI85V_003072 [bacterium]|jgi:hypothetical protein